MDALAERLDWLYAGLALLVVLIPGRRHRLLGAAGLGLALLAAASDQAGGPAGDAAFTTVNEVLALLGAAIVIVALVLGLRRADRDREPVPGYSPSGSRPLYPDPVLLAGLALAAAAPHLLAVELGILLVIAAAARRSIQAARVWWVVVLVAGTGLIGAALVFALTILGPEGGAMVSLPLGPFSPAAERLLVMLLGGGALLLSGLPPLHRSPWRLGAAPLAAILMVRIALPAFPGGVQDWQPLAMLLLAAAGGAAAGLAQWPAVMVAGGLAALWAGVPSGAFAGQLLVLSGWLSGLAAEGRLGPMPRLRKRWRGVPALIPALAALPALGAALRAEVVLSVVFVGLGITGFALAFARKTDPSQPPLY